MPENLRSFDEKLEGVEIEMKENIHLIEFWGFLLVGYGLN